MIKNIKILGLKLLNVEINYATTQKKVKAQLKSHNLMWEHLYLYSKFYDKAKWLKTETCLKNVNLNNLYNETLLLFA